MNTHAVKVLVVEDEILLAKDIQSRLTDIGYHVVATAPSVEKALNSIETHSNIDIILIDIMLKGDRDGIDLAKVINQNYKIPFIFLTSHSDATIVDRAKSAKPYAYILKPFNDQQIAIAIELALLNFSNNTPQKDILTERNQKTDPINVLQIKDSLFLKKNHHFERVPIQDILFLEADSNYCTIYTKTDQFIYSAVLKKIQTFLPHSYFVRTHRSYVVNINSITGFEGNTLFIENNKIPVSKTYKSQVFELFHKI